MIAASRFLGYGFLNSLEESAMMQKQGKMGGAIKNASAGRIKSIQPPANPLKTYGQMQPGDRKGK